ncbi:MAG: hypothetical protein IIC82_06780 [Chloroflexi bacterium]|nr:hypothetical protein [Chloroflexota bacterium]
MAIRCINVTTRCQRCHGALYQGWDDDWHCVSCGRPQGLPTLLASEPEGTMAPMTAKNGTPASDPDKLLEYAVGIFDTAAICASRETDPERRELLRQRCEEIKEIITVLDAQCG